MQNILTPFFERRKALIASQFITAPETTSYDIELVKGASKEQQTKVAKVLHEFKEGSLKSGSGKKIKDHKQAIAVAMSEAGLNKSITGEMAQGLLSLFQKAETCLGMTIKKDMDDGDSAGAGDDMEESVKAKLKKDDSDDEDDDSDDVEQSVTKAVTTDLEKGGKGSNKAGRVIGTTRSGKPVNVFKEAADYKDFEAVDHLEAHKMHLNHSNKMNGVAAVNSRIRAHDHEDQAKIKAMKKEQTEMEEKNAKAEKAKAMGGKTTKPKAKAKSKVEKAFENLMNNEDDSVEKAFENLFAIAELDATDRAFENINKSFSDDLQKGDIYDKFSNGYSSDATKMIFSKSGKEISEKLSVLQIGVLRMISKYKSDMSTIEDQVGETPDDKNSSYSIRGISVPRYSYDYYNSCRPAPEPSTAYGTIAAVAVKEAVSEGLNAYQLCCQYNDMSYKLLNALEDKKAIQLMIDGLEPKKKYPLTVSQLAVLGF